MITLLLTWTIQPNWEKNISSTVLSDKNFFDPESRLKDYFSTIIYYIIHSDFKYLVFCENSGYDFSKELAIINQIANIYNKKFEFLSFVGSKEQIKKYSYHYGEAEIFDYVFENSEFIKKSEKVFKSTWRYRILNINKLLEDYRNRDYFFYKGFWLNSTLCVNTAFFITTPDLYKKKLYKKQIQYYEKCWEKVFIPLEWVFYQLLKEWLFKKNDKILSFPIFHFFNKKTILLEWIKKHLWLLSYNRLGRFLDIFFQSCYTHFYLIKKNKWWLI